MECVPQTTRQDHMGIYDDINHATKSVRFGNNDGIHQKQDIYACVKYNVTVLV